MKLSIIMGAYNVERTIARSIDSILKQTYSDWIFIICDDGSIDNTREIIREYAERYPQKIVSIHNEVNCGLTYTLNHCLKYANTEYIARMDADDISLPKRFEMEIMFLEKHPEYAFVGCAVERFDENGVWKRCNVISQPSKYNFFKSTSFTHPTIMIRRSAIEAVSGYTEKWYTNRCEDYDLWMKLYSKGYKGYNLDQILFQYYEGKESFPKRKYKYRIGEMITRLKGYKALKLLPQGFVFALKPLVAGLLPAKTIKNLHTR